MERFKDKVVVVTGAASGIGAAVVRRLHGEGATVISVDLSGEAAGTLCESLGDDHRCEALGLDVCDLDAVKAVISEIRQRLGRIDGLVNCAGITGVGDVIDLDQAQHNRIMDVNLNGTINMCHAFVQAVKDDGTPRAIVNISSGAGLLGVPNRLSYVASKFGITGITKSMSPELGPLGIRVNAVAPGVTRTPLMDYALQDPIRAKAILDAHPIGRIGEPEEIAAVIVFLLSEDASFMTGSVVSVDGGQTACL